MSGPALRGLWHATAAAVQAGEVGGDGAVVIRGEPAASSAGVGGREGADCRDPGHGGGPLGGAGPDNGVGKGTGWAGRVLLELPYQQLNGPPQLRVSVELRETQHTNTHTHSSQGEDATTTQ